MFWISLYIIIYHSNVIKYNSECKYSKSSLNSNIKNKFSFQQYIGTLRRKHKPKTGQLWAKMPRKLCGNSKTDITFKT